MGIKNLKSIIRKHAPEAIQPVGVNFLNGKRVVIDSSILLYRYRYNFDDDFFHIKGFLYKIKEIIKCDITPIFVFDGTPPQAKQNVLSGRSELRNKMKSNLETFTKELEVLNEEFGQKNVDLFIDSDDESDDNEIKQKIIKVTSEIKKIKKNLLIVNKNHSTEVMELLKSLGVPFFQAPGEAEESCAFLQKNGYADYILTEDTDSLTFGGTNVIMGQELVNLSKVLEKLELSYCEFIDFCILCGCDYTCTIPKIGPVNALKIIKRFRSIENFIKENKTYKIPDSFDYQTARDLFRQNENYHFDVNFKMDLNFREFEKHLIQFNLN